MRGAKKERVRGVRHKQARQPTHRNQREMTHTQLYFSKATHKETATKGNADGKKLVSGNCYHTSRIGSASDSCQHMKIAHSARGFCGAKTVVVHLTTM